MRGANEENNPYNNKCELHRIWDFGFSNTPDIGINEEGYYVAQWACFKCGKLHYEDSSDKEYIMEVVQKLLQGSNFCTDCGDRPCHSIKFKIRRDSSAWNM